MSTPVIVRQIENVSVENVRLGFYNDVRCQLCESQVANRMIPRKMSMLSEDAVYVLLALAAVGVFMGLIFLSFRRAKEEKGLTPLYEERSYIGVLLLRRRWLRRVSLYEKFLVIANGWLNVIHYEDVHSISLRRALLPKCVSLEIHAGLFEGTFFFLAKEPGKAMSILRSYCRSAKIEELQ